MNILKIYVMGVGGQGNVLASKLVGEAALEAGVPVVLSETHGMAQRGGFSTDGVVKNFFSASRASCASEVHWNLSTFLSNL